MVEVIQKESAKKDGHGELSANPGATDPFQGRGKIGKTFSPAIAF